MKTAIQVKRWKRNVSGRTVRELRGGLMTDERGLVITTSSFTRDAVKEASAEGKQPISLVDGEKLLDLLTQNEIGVSRKLLPYLELDLEKLGGFEEEIRVSPGGQALGLWPLPGGKRKLVDSALKMLRYVAQTEPTEDQMVEWMRSVFPSVRSEKTIKGYIRVLKTLGLLIYDGEVIRITEGGSEALAADSKEVILTHLLTHVAGIDSYLEALREHPMTLKDSHEFFKKELSVDWETDYQTKMRIDWLENVGSIIKKGRTYSLRTG